MAIFKIYDRATSTWFEVPIEDPTLYLLLTGDRPMAGNLNMGGYAIVSVGNVDGRDVSADGAVLDTAALLPGRAGGQTLQGGTAAGEDLSLESTAHATKGEIISKDHHEFVKTAAYDAIYDNGTDDGDIVFDLNNGNFQQIELDGDVTSVTIVDPPGPSHSTIWVYQDGVGGHSIVDWDAGIYWGGTEPVIPDTASTWVLILLAFDGSKYVGQMLSGINGLGFGPEP